MFLVFGLCSDKTCKNTNTLAISDTTPKWNSTSTVSHSGHVGLVGVIAVLLMGEANIF